MVTFLATHPIRKSEICKEKCRSLAGWQIRKLRLQTTEEAPPSLTKLHFQFKNLTLAFSFNNLLATLLLMKKYQVLGQKFWQIFDFGNAANIPQKLVLQLTK